MGDVLSFEMSCVLKIHLKLVELVMLRSTVLRTSYFVLRIQFQVGLTAARNAIFNIKPFSNRGYEYYYQYLLVAAMAEEEKSIGNSTRMYRK